ncbi:MAG: PaaI family thioesterase [Selenomonadales bacterium]|nr:PaaI family thioesterase [Selenomonadales bacterium]MDD6219307.1 PaaI family thioesterase [Selenomonadaceae bacterium]
MADMMEDDGFCFACGQNNPIGLKLKFVEIAGRYVAKCVMDKNYQSFNGVLHGGIITTLLDEAMGGYLFHLKQPAYTGKLEVRYRRPTPTGEQLTVSGWIAGRKRNVVEMRSEIALSDGTITAEATAKMVVMEKAEV